MVDKEFTQICKEILGIGKRLEKIEPEELREIKASIERLSEAFNASKESFDESKSDFDGKYNKVAQIVATFDVLKAQIEETLKSGTINDNTESLFSTYSSKKIVDLFSNTKATLSTLTNVLGTKIASSLKGVANGVASLDDGGKLEGTQIPTEVVLNSSDKLIKESLGEVANDTLIKAINNRLAAINVVNLSSAAIDFSKGINFTILKANLAGDSAITISALNIQNNKAKSGAIFIEHSVAGFDASFTLTNPDDFETKQKALFNYYINPIDNKVYLFFVANVG